MRKFLTALISIFLTAAPLIAEWWNPCSCDFLSCFGPRPCNNTPWPSPINLDATMGYRRDTFRWASGRREVDPTSWSDLQWKDLRIVEYSAQGSYVSCRNYALRAWGTYGHIYHGDNKQSDFFENRHDREHLLSRSINNAGKGHVYDASAAVGYRVTSNCRRFWGLPLIGYSHHAQYLHIFEGNQVVSRFGVNPLGPFPGLNSRYKTRWFGPWGGLEFCAQVEKCCYAYGIFEWHQLHYRAEGCWNLRADLGPFFHKAHGFGYLFILGTKWEICRNWAIGLQFGYRNFKTRSGRAKERLREPILGHRTIIEEFNGAKWHSWNLSGVIAWRF